MEGTVEHMEKVPASAEAVVTEEQVVQALADLQRRATVLETAIQQQQNVTTQARLLADKPSKPDTYSGGKDPALVEE